MTKPSFGRTMIALTVAALMLAGTVGHARQADPAEQAFEAARFLEVIERDLRGAVVGYRDILSRYASNRAVAANALLRLGLCYEQLRQPALSTYQRLVRDYGDQAAAVTAARTRLAALAPPRDQAGFSPQLLRVHSDLPSSFSDDGEWALTLTMDLAFTRLILENVVTGQKRTLVERQGDAYANAAVLAPDGRSVVYSWRMYPAGATEPAFALKVIGTEPGAVPVQIAAGSWRPLGWSADGRSVLVRAAIADRPGAYRVGWMTMADGRFTPLRDFEAGSFGPVLSPDRTAMAYVPAADSGSNDTYVHVMDASPGAPSSAVVTMAGRNLNPVWTPDGSRILFRNTRSGQAGLWVADVNRAGPPAEPQLVQANFSGYLVAVTGRGDLYYTVELPGVFSEFIARRAAGGARIEQTFKGQGATWSTDGRLAFFRSGTDGAELIVRTMATGQERLYRVERLALAPPQWLSDNTGLIVFVQDGSSPVGAAYRFDLSDGRATRLFPLELAGKLYGPWGDLSPDGRTLYLPVRGGRQQPWEGVDAIDVATGVARRVATLSGDATRPASAPGVAVSPDGAWLAINMWAEWEASQSKIVIARTDGGDVRDVYGPYHADHAPGRLRWAPDGQSILFAANTDTSPGRPGGWQLMRVPAMGGAVTPEGIDSTRLDADIPLPVLNGGNLMNNFDVSPDGSQIAFSARTVPTSEFWRVDNVTAFLGQR